MFSGGVKKTTFSCNRPEGMRNRTLQAQMRNRMEQEPPAEFPEAEPLGPEVMALNAKSLARLQIDPGPSRSCAGSASGRSDVASTIGAQSVLGFGNSAVRAQGIRDFVAGNHNLLRSETPRRRPLLMTHVLKGYLKHLHCCTCKPGNLPSTTFQTMVLWCLQTLDGANFFPWALASLIPSKSFGIPQYFDAEGNMVGEHLFENYFLTAMTTYEPVVPKSDYLMPVDGVDGSKFYEPNMQLHLVNQTQVAYAACTFAFKKDVLGKRERRGGSDASDVLSTISRTSKKRMISISEDQTDDQPNEPVASRPPRSAQVPTLVLLDEWDINTKVPVDKSILTDT